MNHDCRASMGSVQGQDKKWTYDHLQRAQCGNRIGVSDQGLVGLFQTSGFRSKSWLIVLY